MSSEPGQTPLVGLIAMGLAAAGIALSLAGRHLGDSFLESRAGPSVTLLGAAVWTGYRVLRGRRH